MKERCEREVLELHQFFEDWFNGVLPDDDDSFGRFDRVVAEGFVIVAPTGSVSGREALVERLRGAHAGWVRGEGQPGRIWIEKLQLRRVLDDVAIATYEEWQTVAGETRGRLSTVVFGRREDAPNGLEWLHVHEVWLPDSQ